MFTAISFLFIAPLFLLATATWFRWRRFAKHSDPRFQFHLSDHIVWVVVLGVSLLAFPQGLFPPDILVENRSVLLVLFMVLVAAYLFAGKLWHLTTENYSNPPASATYMVVGVVCGLAIEVGFSVCFAAFSFLNAISSIRC